MAGLAPGPFGAMMLADMGAQVLRVERQGPVHRPIESRFNLIDRNRRSIALDLKSDAGLAVMKRLLGTTDVLIEGFRPGVMERLGLGPIECLALNPHLVYGRMTGWGQDGPLAPRPGHDINYIGLIGALDAVGTAGGPPVPPLNLVGDFGGGGMYLAFGVVCALLERVRSGRGQVVDAAMVDGAASLMTYFHGMRAAGKWTGRGRTVVGGGAPYYGAFETSDGLYITIASAEPQFYTELLRLLDLDPASLPDRRDSANWPALHARFASIFKTRTRAQWDALLQDSEVCYAPMLSMEEALSHPHNLARNTFVEVDGIPQPAPAPRFSRTPAGVPAAGVPAGVDPVAALTGWGFSCDELQTLAEAGTLR